MKQSQMITTRRRKAKGKKRLARDAKQMKKLRRQNIKLAGTEIPNENNPKFSQR